MPDVVGLWREIAVCIAENTKSNVRLTAFFRCIVQVVSSFDDLLYADKLVTYLLFDFLPTK